MGVVERTTAISGVVAVIGMCGVTAPDALTDALAIAGSSQRRTSRHNGHGQHHECGYQK
jgi:hypothetical protein